ncbi:hypothetical protein [Vibrio sp. 03_296]|uniref:hypothetical protein n=1 Tax=Vibrio sp. 03_296 TaxID=2024409 RepID=UPI002D80803C|nr:hypothetical protein [Vibrio sp. 03_296]
MLEQQAQQGYPGAYWIINLRASLVSRVSTDGLALLAAAVSAELGKGHICLPLFE